MVRDVVLGVGFGMLGGDEKMEVTMLLHGEPIVVTDTAHHNGQDDLYYCIKALKLLRSRKTLAAEAIFQAIALLHIKPCITLMKEELKWDEHEESFAEYHEIKFAQISTINLLTISNKRITHTQKKKRMLRTSTDDLRVGLLMATISDIPDDFEEYLKQQFFNHYRADQDW